MGELALHVVVAAHRDELWQDFVDMSLFAQWWWPFADTTYVADVREGGTYRFAFTDADDATTSVEIVHEAASDELESLRQGWEHCLQRLVARYV